MWLFLVKTPILGPTLPLLVCRGFSSRGSICPGKASSFRVWFAGVDVVCFVVGVVVVLTFRECLVGGRVLWVGGSLSVGVVRSAFTGLPSAALFKAPC